MKRSISLQRCACLAFAIVQLLLPSAAPSQSLKPEGAIIDGHVFAVRPFVPGEPDFPPIKRWLAGNRSYATINLADTLGTLYICSGRGRNSKLKVFLLHHLPNRLWTRVSLDLSDVVQDTLQTSLDLPLLKWRGAETPFPVEIRVALPSQSLLFRWMLSPDDPTNPGGRPVPAHIALEVGEPLFDFAVVDLSGRLLRSSELRGTITMLDWWFTSCGACVAEIPGFNQLVRKYGSRVRFLAVATDDPHRVRDFLIKHPFLFRQSTTSDSIYDFIGGGAPHTVIVDAQGIVRFETKGGGSESFRQFGEVIDTLLAKNSNER